MFPVTVAVVEPVILWTATALNSDGTMSMNVAPRTGLGPALPMVSVNVTVWPTAWLGLMLALTRLRSELGATESVSSAEHTPDVQEGDGLVFTTPAGGAT